MAENIITKGLENIKEDAKVTRGVKSLVKGMKGKLAKCPQVEIKVPIDKQNPKDLEVTVQINGYVYLIKRGETVKVPAPVKKLLERAGHI